MLAQWEKTLFLRDENVEARGWLIEVMKCVESIGRRDFHIDDVYAFAEPFEMGEHLAPWAGRAGPRTQAFGGNAFRFATLAPTPNDVTDQAVKHPDGPAHAAFARQRQPGIRVHDLGDSGQ